MDLSPLLRGLQRNRTIYRIMAGVTIALTIGLCFIPGEKSNEMWIKIALVAFFGLMSVGWVFGGLRDPEKYRVIRTLRESPADVAWLYPVRRLQNGVHAATVIYFCLKSGKRLECPVWPKDQEAAVMQTLRQVCPNADIGFTTEAERRWKAGASA
jgi:hypothetical protein